MSSRCQRRRLGGVGGVSECDKKTSGREAGTHDRRGESKGTGGHRGVIEMRGGAGGGERGQRGGSGG